MIDTLVATINRKKDWQILQTKHWYRIPVKSSPQILPKIEYLAFYKTTISGEETNGINYYAKIKECEIVKRSKLLPDEPSHTSAQNDYYKITIDDLKKLPFPIPSKRKQRIVFIPTTLNKLMKAREINDLYDTSYLEETLYKAMKGENILSERQWFVRENEQIYCLDFAVFCNKGTIDIECDGKKWHSSEDAHVYDNKRNNELASDGWVVLRFREEEIKQDIKKCVSQVRKAVSSLEGLKTTNEENLGHRERLRDKFLKSGFSGFHDYEIIELLLTLGTPRRDCKKQAKEALEKFKTLRGVLSASSEELQRIKGIGPVNVFGIKLIQKAAEELFKEKLFKEEIKYDEQVKYPKTVFDYLYSAMSDLKIECFKVLFLDTKNRIIEIEDLFQGTINASSVWPREIIKSAIRHNAASVIFVHNHPSGDPTPSQSDTELTKNLVSAIKTVEIKVLDHIIIGKNSYFSFAEKSLI